MRIIKPHTFIYYIQGHRFEIGFSSSSKPLFEVTSIEDNSNFFEDGQFTKEIWNKVKRLKSSSLIGLMTKLDKELGEECMAFNLNA
jgi:hypothetical protein